jgi:hypothetical protein
MTEFLNHYTIKRNRFTVRETIELKEEVFKMFEDRLPVMTIVRLSGLTYNNISKLRDIWRDRNTTKNVPRAVPKIELSDEFVRSRIGLLQNPQYARDCELATLPGILEHYLELREASRKKVDPLDSLL